MQVNKLAEVLDMDPVELRMRNLWRDGDTLPTRSALPAGVTAVETLAAAAEQVGWRQGEGGAGGMPCGRRPHRQLTQDASAGRSLHGHSARC